MEQIEQIEQIDNTTQNNTNANVSNNIKECCQHKWIIDYIDIDPDTSMQICYCIKCEETKK